MTYIKEKLPDTIY